MSSMVLDGASPRSRSTDPITSVDAGRAANLSKSQAAVLELLGKGEFTQPEAEWFLDGWSPSRIRSAFSELEERGLIEPLGVTKLTRYGRKARVYRAVTT